MGIFTRDLKTLEDLFMHGLKDIYYAENQIVKNLPKMIEAASDAELKKAPEGASRRDREPGLRAWSRCSSCSARTRAVRAAPASTASSTEGDEVLGDVEGRSVTNAAVVASAQAVEHYEITRYGTSDRLGDRARQGRGRSAVRAQSA